MSKQINKTRKQTQEYTNYCMIQNESLDVYNIVSTMFSECCVSVHKQQYTTCDYYYVEHTGEYIMLNYSVRLINIV